MKLLSALGGGLAGAVALTLVHEIGRRVDKKAPRMDLLGMQALGKVLKKSHTPVPKKKNLFMLTLAGEIISNTLYYSLAAPRNKKQIITKGAVLGLAAGIGALALPEPLGLNKNYSNRSLRTQLITSGLYLFGGLVSSAATRFLEPGVKTKIGVTPARK